MGATVTYDGYQELRAFLESLPDTTKDQIATIMLDTVEQTKNDLQAVYPPGAMRESVFTSTSQTTGVIGVKGTVLSATPEAQWWEFGTAVRATQEGWNRGSEPAHKDRGLGTIARRNRARMKRAVMAFVEHLGFDVTET